MPYVRIEVTPPNVTKEQKQAVIQGVTKVLVDVLNKNPESTHIVIEEIETDNWGFNGKQVSQRLKGSTQTEN